MASLVDFYNTVNQNNKITNLLSFSNSIGKVLQQQMENKNSFPILNLIDAVQKSIEQHQQLSPTFLSSFGGIVKFLSTHSKYSFQESSFVALNSLVIQQEKLFGNIRKSTVTINCNPAFSQINSLQWALGGISSRLSVIAASQKQLGFIKEFENLSEQTIGITNNPADDYMFTEDEKKRFKELFAVIITFLKRNKKIGIQIFLAVNILIMASDIHQYYDFLKPKPELLSKEEFLKFKNYMVKEINVVLKQEKEYRTTNRVCKVMLKPTSKTLSITTLPKDFDVIVFQIKHKWIYISYSNPKDNLPQTGWILKKYLIKP